MDTSTGVEVQAGGAPPPRPRRRWLWAAIGALVVGFAAFVLVWFQPQKLWIDDRVDEPVPAARPAAESPTTAVPTTDPGASTAPTTVVPPEVDLFEGEFVSLDHGTTGRARILQLSDGRRFLRFEGFETSNGPDLFVYFSTNPADGPEGAFDDDYLDLGRLTGNIGDQNYELPPDADPSAYASVVVWCDRFDSAFGAANLTPAAPT